MLKANNKPSERQQSTATGATKDTASGNTSEPEMKAKLETPGSDKSIDKESVSIQLQTSRKTHSLPYFTEEQLRAARYSFCRVVSSQVWLIMSDTTHTLTTRQYSPPPLSLFTSLEGAALLQQTLGLLTASS